MTQFNLRFLALNALLISFLGLLACTASPPPASDTTLNSAETPAASSSNALDDADKKADKDSLGSIIGPNNANENTDLYKTVAPTNKGFEQAKTYFRDQRVKGRIGTFKDTELDVTVTDYEFELGTDTSGNGAANESAKAQIKIGTLGQHQVSIAQENFPTMSNERDSLTITDQTSGNIRNFTADQDLYNYTIEGDNDEVTIETQPDGSWLVNGASADTPEAVVALAMKSPAVSEASVHGVMLLYQALNQMNSLPVDFLIETLSPISCDSGSSNINAAPSFGDPRSLLKALIQHQMAG